MKSDGNVSLSVGVLDAYPVGSIYMSVNSTSPSTLFGGTWEALDQGRVLIGAGTAHPAGETGGEETHTLTTNEMPSHSHSGSTDTDGSHGHNIYYGSYGDKSHASVDASGMDRSDRSMSGSYRNFTANGGSHWHYVYLDNTGGGSAHNNMQPYLSVYMWKRTA